MTCTVTLSNTADVVPSGLLVVNPLSVGLVYAAGSAVGFTDRPEAQILT